MAMMMMPMTIKANIYRALSTSQALCEVFYRHYDSLSTMRADENESD